MTETAVSREEFRALSQRVDMIDASGTRGVAVLAVQIQEIAKDFSRHEEKHDRQESARAASRRWLVMAAIALVGAIDLPIVTVILASHGHLGPDMTAPPSGGLAGALIYGKRTAASCSACAAPPATG